MGMGGGELLPWGLGLKLMLMLKLTLLLLKTHSPLTPPRYHCHCCYCW